MQNVVQVLEKQYLEEKRTALEEQRMMYERELETLRQQLSPEKTPQRHSISSNDRLTFPAHTPHSRLRLWTEERSVKCAKHTNDALKHKLHTAERPTLELTSGVYFTCFFFAVFIYST